MKMDKIMSNSYAVCSDWNDALSTYKSFDVGVFMMTVPLGTSRPTPICAESCMTAFEPIVVCAPTSLCSPKYTFSSSLTDVPVWQCTANRQSSPIVFCLPILANLPRFTLFPTTVLSPTLAKLATVVWLPIVAYECTVQNEPIFAPLWTFAWWPIIRNEPNRAPESITADESIALNAPYEICKSIWISELTLNFSIN